MRKEREPEHRRGGPGLGRRARHGLSAALQVLVTPEEKRDIQRAASVLGISASRFASRAVLRDAELVLAGSKFKTSGQWLRPTYERILNLMGSCRDENAASMGWISHELAIGPAVLSREIDELESLGLIERRRIKGRRGIFLYLTAKGREAWDRAQSIK
jgi:hypothetical protein